MLETASGTLQKCAGHKICKLGWFSSNKDLRIGLNWVAFSHVSITRALFSFIYQWHLTWPINIVIDPSPDLPMDKSDTSRPRLWTPTTCTTRGRVCVTIPPACPGSLSMCHWAWVQINSRSRKENKNNFHPTRPYGFKLKTLIDKLTFYPFTIQLITTDARCPILHHKLSRPPPPSSSGCTAGPTLGTCEPATY